MAGIRRDFLPDDLKPHLSAGVEGFISVQARQSEEETRWLLELAASHGFIRGVVGWVDLAAKDVRRRLEKFATPKLVGIRHVVQGEPEGFLLRPDFDHGVAVLREFDLAYDILVFERQLFETIMFVDRHPNQVFILDHLAKPNVQRHELEPWRRNMVELAKRSNVYCKISGGVFEADPMGWTPAILQPYFDAALEAFGPLRLMFGSNWPLTEPAGGYGRWLDTVLAWAEVLSESERASLFSGAALEAYGLEKRG